MNCLINLQLFFRYRQQLTAALQHNLGLLRRIAAIRARLEPPHTPHSGAAAAAAPIILNVVLILSLIYSYTYDLDYTKNLSYGVTIAGIVQLFFLIYA